MTNFSLNKLSKNFVSLLKYASVACLSKANSASIAAGSATRLEALVLFWTADALPAKQAAATNVKIRRLFGFIMFFLVEEVLSAGNRGISSNENKLSDR